VAQAYPPREQHMRVQNVASKFLASEFLAPNPWRQILGAMTPRQLYLNKIKPSGLTSRRLVAKLFGSILLV
jgi:hypothetical protein